MKNLNSLKKTVFVGLSSLVLALGLFAAPAVTLANDRGDHHRGDRHHREDRRHRDDRHDRDRHDRDRHDRDRHERHRRHRGDREDDRFVVIRGVTYDVFHDGNGPYVRVAGIKYYLDSGDNNRTVVVKGVRYDVQND